MPLDGVKRFWKDKLTLPLENKVFYCDVYGTLYGYHYDLLYLTNPIKGLIVILVICKVFNLQQKEMVLKVENCWLFFYLL